MTIDDVVSNIPTDEPGLIKSWNEMIAAWKVSNRNVNELGLDIERWHSGIWFKNDTERNHFLQVISEFKSNFIDKIGGMTVNERLYHFGLFEIYDNYHNKETIYRKINAAQQGDAPDPTSVD